MLTTAPTSPAVRSPSPPPPLRLVLTLRSGAALHRLCGEELARGGLFVPFDVLRPVSARVDVEVVVDDVRFVLACVVLQGFPSFGTALALTAAAGAAVEALMAHALFVPPTGDAGAFRFDDAAAAVNDAALRRALAEALEEVDELDALGALDELDELEQRDALDDEEGVDAGLDAAAGAGVDDVGDPAALALHAAVARMTLAEKRHAALHGPRDVRLLLARDRNPALHLLVVKNPGFTLDDADALARMPSLSSDALHLIARDWAKTPAVIRHLVKNPRTPIGDAVALVPRLAPADVRALAKSGGARQPIVTAARRLVTGHPG